jgi:hypothetical protein
MLPMLRDREGSVPRLSRLDQLFNETLADWVGGRMPEALGREGWFPAVDIRGEEGVLTFVADLPAAPGGRSRQGRGEVRQRCLDPHGSEDRGHQATPDLDSLTFSGASPAGRRPVWAAFGSRYGTNVGRDPALNPRSVMEGNA